MVKLLSGLVSGHHMEDCDITGSRGFIDMGIRVVQPSI